MRAADDTTGLTSCAWSLDNPTEAITWANVVFVGTITRVTSDGMLATVHVDQVWKGSVAAVERSASSSGLVIAMSSSPRRHLRPTTRLCGVRAYDSSLDAHRPADAHPPTTPSRS